MQKQGYHGAVCDRLVVEQIKKALPAASITSDMKLDKAIELIKDTAKPKKKTKKKAEDKTEETAE